MPRFENVEPDTVIRFAGVEFKYRRRGASIDLEIGAVVEVIDPEGALTRRMTMVDRDRIPAKPLTCHVPKE